MPNSILPQDTDGQELYNAISSLFRTFGIGKMLRKCNARKEKRGPCTGYLQPYFPEILRLNHPEEQFSTSYS